MAYIDTDTMTLAEYRQKLLENIKQESDPMIRERQRDQLMALTTGVHPYMTHLKMVEAGLIPWWVHLDYYPGAAREVGRRWYEGDGDHEPPYETWGKKWDEEHRKDSMRHLAPPLTDEDLACATTS